FQRIGRKVHLGPPVPADHTATLEVITQPRAWTVLYAEAAGGTQVPGIRLLHEAERRLRVPVRAVLSPTLQRSVEFHDLIAALRRQVSSGPGGVARLCRLTVYRCSMRAAASSGTSSPSR